MGELGSQMSENAHKFGLVESHSLRQAQRTHKPQSRPPASGLSTRLCIISSAVIERLPCPRNRQTGPAGCHVPAHSRDLFLLEID